MAPLLGAMAVSFCASMNQPRITETETQWNSIFKREQYYF
jgi:hypothetical protein